MAKNVTYFDMAENDYKFLYDDYERGRVGNVMCYAAQNICERYLKHVIDIYCTNVNTTDVLKTHSIKIIKKFITNEIPEFNCNWRLILNVDGYYFSARCPGEESFIVDKDDVDECWGAVEETRRAVIDFMDTYSIKTEDITKDEEVIRILDKFNNK